MLPEVYCDRCGRSEPYVAHFWSTHYGLLCDDCNLEAGIFYGMVVDVMLGFGNLIKWSYKRVKVEQPKYYGNTYDDAWMRGELVV